MMSSLLPRHSLLGLSTRKVSVSFRPIGSRPSSSEPTRATIDLTSGTLAKMACCTRVSMAMEASSEMDGTFCSCTRMSPSSSVGMKVLPICVYRPAASTSEANAPSISQRVCRQVVSRSQT